MSAPVVDKIRLTNDSAGFNYADEVYFGGQINEASALTGSFLAPLAGPMRSAGRIMDFWIGVVAPATSASGFVSGTVTAEVKINSVTVLSTAPAIKMAGSAGQAVRTNTQTSTAQAVKAVMGPIASTRFSAGDQLQVDLNMRSVGSAAAGAAGTGLTWGCTVRFNAQ